MSLALPTVDVTSGPLYASLLNIALTSIDSHNHTSGQGLPIPSGALSIDADIAFNNFNLTNVRSLRLQDQLADITDASDVGALYLNSGDLYFNDGTPSHVRITAGGAVNVAASGNITGMGATTATAFYTGANNRFSFLSNTNTPANMTFGPLKLGLNAVSPFYVNITPNGSQAADYTLTLPIANPSVQTIMTLDNAGQIAAAYVLDNTTINTTGNQIQVKPQGITATQIANSTITTTQIATQTLAPINMASANWQSSASSGNWVSTTTSYTQVTNMSVTITSTGRPIMIWLDQYPGSVSPGYIFHNTPSTNSVGYFQITHNASTVVNSVALGCVMPPSTVFYVHSALPGAHTYTLQGKAQAGYGIGVFACRLNAMEI